MTDSNVYAAPASAIASQVTVSGIDVQTILLDLLPVFVKLLPLCLAFANPTPSQAKEMLASHYDPTTGTFDPGFVEQQRRHTRIAARRGGHRGLAREELDNITIATLKHGMNASDDEWNSVLN